MDRHDPDRIVVVFGQDRVGIAALTGHQVDPAEIAPESVSACVAPGAGLIDDVAHAAPHVAAVGVVESRIEQAAFVDQRCQQVGRREPGAAFGQRAEVVERFADRVPGQLLGNVCPDRPGPAPGLPVVQIDVAAPVQWRAQGGHQSELVGGIVGGPQRQHQVPDLGGRVDDRAVLGPIREVAVAQRRLERRQRRAGRQQHGDVARSARSQHGRSVLVAVADRPALEQCRRHRVGGVGRFAPAQCLGALARVEIGVLVDTDHRHRTLVEEVLAACFERSICGLHVGFVHDQVGEHVIHPVEHLLRRSEVGRQPGRSCRDLRCGAHVLSDVGASEAIDRLLRIADDEQPAG